MFGPKNEEVTAEWRRLNKKELYALYSSTNIVRVIKSRRLRWAGHVARMGERRGAYRGLVGKPEGRRQIRRPRRRWEKSIKIGFKQVVWGSMDWIDWIHLAQKRERLSTLLNAAVNLRIT
jgi:hypothetical protein